MHVYKYNCKREVGKENVEREGSKKRNHGKRGSEGRRGKITIRVRDKKQKKGKQTNKQIHVI